MDLGLRFGEKFRTRERKEKKKNTTVERERGMEEKIARRGGIPNDFQDFSTSIINRCFVRGVGNFEMDSRHVGGVIS